MKIGISTAALKQSGPLEPLLPQLIGENFREIELVVDNPPNLPDEYSHDRIEALIRLRESNELTYIVHSPYFDINPMSTIPKVRNFALDMIEDAFRFAHSIQARLVVVHTGYAQPYWRKDRHLSECLWGSFQYTANRLHEYERHYGVSVSIENGFHHYGPMNGPFAPLHVGITSLELLQIVTHVSGKLGITLHIAKVPLSGLDLVQYLQDIGPLINHVHVTWTHSEAIEIVLEYLIKIGYQQCLMIESPLREAPRLQMYLLSLIDKLTHQMTLEGGLK